MAHESCGRREVWVEPPALWGRATVADASAALMAIGLLRTPIEEMEEVLAQLTIGCVALELHSPWILEYRRLWRPDGGVEVLRQDSVVVHSGLNRCGGLRLSIEGGCEAAAVQVSGRSEIARCQRQGEPHASRHVDHLVLEKCTKGRITTMHQGLLLAAGECVESHGADKRDVDPEAAVYSRTFEAERDAVGHRNPRRWADLGIAIKAHALNQLRGSSDRNGSVLWCCFVRLGGRFVLWGCSLR